LYRDRYFSILRGVKEIPWGEEGMGREGVAYLPQFCFRCGISGENEVRAIHQGKWRFYVQGLAVLGLAGSGGGLLVAKQSVDIRQFAHIGNPVSPTIILPSRCSPACERYRCHQIAEDVSGLGSAASFLDSKVYERCLIVLFSL